MPELGGHANEVSSEFLSLQLCIHHPSSLPPPTHRPRVPVDSVAMGSGKRKRTSSPGPGADPEPDFARGSKKSKSSDTRDKSADRKVKIVYELVGTDKTYSRDAGERNVLRRAANVMQIRAHSIRSLPRSPVGLVCPSLGCKCSMFVLEALRCRCGTVSLESLVAS